MNPHSTDQPELPTSLPEAVETSTDSTPDSRKESRAAGAKLRLGIMAVLALVALLGTWRGSIAEGDSATIDLDTLAEERAVLDPLDGAIESIDLADSPEELAAEAVVEPDNEPVASTVTVVGGVDGEQAIAVVETQDDQETVVGLPPICETEEAPAALVPAETVIEPVAADPETAPLAVEGVFYADDFGVARAEWRPLSGEWGIADGSFVQADVEGFDRIAEFALPVALPARVSVELTTLEGVLGGGVMVAQPTPGSRNGATTIDFTAEGRFVRWGSYDESTGVYVYQGGVGLADEFDPSAPHEIAVDLTAEWTIVRIDGAEVGRFGGLPAGQVGLVTSVSSIAFDNFTVTELNN